MADRPAWAVAIDEDRVSALEKCVNRGECVPEAFGGPGCIYTPVGYAVYKGRVGLVRKLLECGVELDEECTEFRSGESDVDDLLSGQGMEKASRWSPLIRAIEDGNLEIVKLLLEYGASAHGSQALEAALRSASPRLEIVAHLVERMEGSSIQKDFVMFATCRKVDPGIVAHLIRKGCPTASIKALDLSNMGLETLPPWLILCPNLKKLTLQPGNPLSTLPVDLRTEKQLPVILEYLQSIEQSGKVPWFKCKIVVLGKEGVGKTHILRRMQRRPYAENQSTNGIDVNEFQLGQYELTWFDFGGQEVFYPTHQFFLTPQCVFLLVFRFNDPDYLDRVRHWLRTLKEFTSALRSPSKVVAVATHSDKASASEQEAVWRQVIPLLEAHGNVVACASVDCASGTGFKVLEKSILDAIQNSGFASQLVPKSFMQVWEWIIMNRGRIFKMDRNSICAEFPNLSELSVSNALRFLTSAGICIFAKELDLVVLNLQWLANTFKEVVSFYSGVKEGIVTLPALRHNAWRRFPDDEIRQNMRILEKFDMACPRVERDSWIVPSMLKDQAPAQLPVGSRKPLSWHVRTFDMDLMPHGAIGRLIVRMHGQGHDLRLTHTWRHGIDVETHDGAQVGRITLERGEQVQLVVTCWALEASRGTPLIQILAEECGAMLKLMYERWTSPPYREFVSCPHCLRLRSPSPNRFSMATCVEYVVKNRATFLCRSENVPVGILWVDVALGDLQVYDDSVMKVASDAFAAGAFGLVYKAHHSDYGDVVVKELDPGKAAAWREHQQTVEQGSTAKSARSALPQTQEEQTIDLEAFADFQHEAALMGKLRHDNIVRLYGIMLNPLRMVLEWCMYGNLYSALKAHKVWKESVNLADALVTIPSLCWRIILDTAKGVAFLHSQTPPIAHRDLRSPNVLLLSLDPQAACCAKVADFGLSTPITSRQTTNLQSWNWMAPEAQQGANYTHMCDVYSLAIVANEVFTQRVPFSEYKEEKRQIDIMREIMAVPGLRPRIPAFVPGWMRLLLESLWQNDPEQRPSMQECLVALQNKGRVANKTGTHHGINNAVLTRVVYENEPNIPRFLVANFQEVWLGYQDQSQIYVLSARNATEVLRTESHRDAECVTCLATPNERIAVSGSNKGTLCFWREEKERKQSVTSSKKSRTIGKKVPSLLELPAPSRKSDAEEKRNSSASTPKEERKGGLLSRLISPRSSSHTLRLSTGDVQESSSPESVPRRSSTIGRQAGRAVSTCGQCHKQFSAHDLSRASELNGILLHPLCMVEYRKARRLAKSSQDAPSRISIPTIPSEPASVGIVSILPIGDKRFWILSASGTISIVSDTNEIVATETHADGVIKCACIVGDSVWFGVETQIYKASCHDRKIVISLVLDLGAMSTTDVAHLVCVSTTREVWASTSGGNLCVLDALSSKKKEEFSADTHVFSMCVVDMSEVQTVWLGLRDQINVFDCHSRSLRSILPSPCRGVVVSMVPVSYGVVWSGIKNENTGSLVVWNFCQ